MNRSQQSRCGTDRASTSLEFALFAMAGLLLLLAGTDLVAYLRSRMQLDQVSGSMASLVTSYQQLYAGDFPALFQTAQAMAGNIKVSGQEGATIITGFSNPAGVPMVAWRQQTGNAAFSSYFGALGDRPRNLPDNYAIPQGSSVVAVELFSSVHPWVLSADLMGTIGTPTARSVTMFQPRGSLLSEITAGARP